MKIEDRKEDLSYITGVVNAMAESEDFDIYYTEHCKDRMSERDITLMDILHVLKNGIIDSYQGVSRENSKVHKYKITGTPLNGEKNIREISLVILLEINNFKNPAIKLQKIITSMWKDL